MKIASLALPLFIGIRSVLGSDERPSSVDDGVDQFSPPPSNTSTSTSLRGINEDKERILEDVVEGEDEDEAGRKYCYSCPYGYDSGGYNNPCKSAVNGAVFPGCKDYRSYVECGYNAKCTEKKCPPDAYWDPNLKACFCSGGQEWDMEENQCFCPDGECFDLGNKICVGVDHLPCVTCPKVYGDFNPCSSVWGGEKFPLCGDSDFFVLCLPFHQCLVTPCPRGQQFDMALGKCRRPDRRRKLKVLCPTAPPTPMPSPVPSTVPSTMPSVSDMPSEDPSMMPSDMPSDVPSMMPSEMPSKTPSDMPVGFCGNDGSVCTTMEPFPNGDVACLFPSADEFVGKTGACPNGAPQPQSCCCKISPSEQTSCQNSPSGGPSGTNPTMPETFGCPGGFPVVQTCDQPGR